MESVGDFDVECGSADGALGLIRDSVLTCMYRP
jgi:hypothetical protein